MKIGGVKKALNSEIMGWLLLGAGTILFLSVMKRAKQGVKNVVTTISAVAYPGTTLTAQQVTDIANKIATAWGGILNDDEQAVYEALNRLYNEQDLKYLMAVYDYKGENLSTSIRRRMSTNEIQKCNNILANHLINYRF